jgi:hypothetical protein
LKYRRRGITQKKAATYEEPPMKMEQKGCYETLAYKIQTPGITQKKVYSIHNWLLFGKGCGKLILEQPAGVICMLIFVMCWLKRREIKTGM